MGYKNNLTIYNGEGWLSVDANEKVVRVENEIGLFADLVNVWRHITAVMFLFKEKTKKNILTIDDKCNKIKIVLPLYIQYRHRYYSFT